MKKALKTIAIYATPWPTISRTGKSLAGSATRIVAAARAARMAMRQPSQPAPSGEPEPRYTPEERFQQVVSARGLTERDLAIAAGKRRWARWCWYVGAAVTLLGGLRLISAGGVENALVGLLALLAMPIFLGLAWREGWREYQICRRALVSAREFTGAPEFFRWMIT